jgi:hypothetical protein
VTCLAHIFIATEKAVAGRWLIGSRALGQNPQRMSGYMDVDVNADIGCDSHSLRLFEP